MIEQNETPVKRSRGRPRPQETITRDDAVLGALTDEGMTRAEISAATGVPETAVYGSLWRLRRDGKVHRIHVRGAHRWFQGSEQQDE